MFKGIKEFFANESGAVTVDWVVLTAAVVGLAMITYVGLAENTGMSRTMLKSVSGDAADLMVTQPEPTGQPAH